MEVLVEGVKRGNSYGRSRSDKIVFFPNGRDHSGELVEARIESTSPWSLKGTVSTPA